jgi:hypothetical protein
MRLVNRRVLVVAGGWLAAALVAMLAGVGGIRLIGESLTGAPGGVLSEEDVARALAAQSAPPSKAVSSGSATASTSAVPTPPAGQDTFTTPGGSAIAHCIGLDAYLDFWSPRPGYQAEETDKGPDDDVGVIFVGDGGRYALEIACRNGTPYLAPDDD